MLVSESAPWCCIKTSDLSTSSPILFLLSLLVLPSPSIFQCDHLLNIKTAVGTHIMHFFTFKKMAHALTP